MTLSWSFIGIVVQPTSLGRILILKLLLVYGMSVRCIQDAE